MILKIWTGMSFFRKDVLFEICRSSGWLDLLFLLLACLELHRFTPRHIRCWKIKDNAALGQQPKCEASHLDSLCTRRTALPTWDDARYSGYYSVNHLENHYLYLKHYYYYYYYYYYRLLPQAFSAWYFS